MRSGLPESTLYDKKYFLWFVGGLIMLFVPLLTYHFLLGSLLTLVISVFVLFVILLWYKPVLGFYIFCTYCFVFSMLIKELPDIPLGLGVEFFLVMTWLAVFVNYRRFSWDSLRNNLIGFFAIWLFISCLQLLNPSGASFRGWIQEIRSAAVYPLLVTSLLFLFIHTSERLRAFIILCLALSLLATLNGIRQKYLGMFPGEQNFVNTSPTHLLFGQLRVFSIYSDAGQFGASQAGFALLAFVLCLGPYRTWKRIVLVLLGIGFIYGMLISGTRGALFSLLTGALAAIVLSRQFNIMFIGSVFLGMLYVFLRFTTIGNGIYEINRLRTALDPQEASLNVRLENQKILATYLENKPFGDGLGVIGHWGKEYNKHMFLSTIEPDSYWVKIWAMYGIVGLILWFSMMMYLFGKSSAIAWKLNDKRIRNQAIAFFSASIGLFFSSYGNEVMNTMPSLLMFCAGLVIVYVSPSLERKKADETNSLRMT